MKKFHNQVTDLICLIVLHLLKETTWLGKNVSGLFSYHKKNIVPNIFFTFFCLRNIWKSITFFFFLFPFLSLVYFDITSQPCTFTNLFQHISFSRLTSCGTSILTSCFETSTKDVLFRFKLGTLPYFHSYTFYIQVSC